MATNGGMKNGEGRVKPENNAHSEAGKKEGDFKSEIIALEKVHRFYDKIMKWTRLCYIRQKNYINYSKEVRKEFEDVLLVQLCKTESSYVWRTSMFFCQLKRGKMQDV